MEALARLPPAFGAYAGCAPCRAPGCCVPLERFSWLTLLCPVWWGSEAVVCTTQPPCAESAGFTGVWPSLAAASGRGWPSCSCGSEAQGLHVRTLPKVAAHH